MVLNALKELIASIFRVNMEVIRQKPEDYYRDCSFGVVSRNIFAV
jgi:hypothetical protein